MGRSPYANVMRACAGNLFVAVKFAAAAVFKGVAIFEIILVRNIGGEEAARHGHDNADKQRVPGQAE